MELKSMCNIITPYRCPNCNNDILLFTRNNSNMAIDYKKLIDNGMSLKQIKDYLYERNINILNCICCHSKFMIDWTNGYPEPLTDINILNRFNYKFKE